MKKKRNCTIKRQIDVYKTMLSNVLDKMECGSANLKELYIEALELNDKININKMKLTR